MKNLLLVSMFLMMACGGSSSGYGGGDRSQQEENPSTPQPENFEDRISTQLSFKGVECNGGEQVEIQEGDEIKTVTCERDQWQLTVDNANTCSANGSCTEIFVFPFIGELILLNESEERSEYGFGALTQVNAETADDIKDHKVRFTRDSDPQVLRR